MDDDDLAQPQYKPLVWDWWVLPTAAILLAEGVSIAANDALRIIRSATVGHLYHRVERASFEREAGLWIESLGQDDA